MYMIQTQLTRQIAEGRKNPSRNYTNGKPYRTAAQKRKARETAERGADTVFRTNAPRSYHKPVK